MNSLFIFRLDIRLRDNTALIECFKNSKNIYPCFIFEPKQISEKINKYFSHNCVQFMIESLKNYMLIQKKKLLFWRYLEIIEYLIKKLDINSIYLNQDYTPFSIQRDKNIEDLCSKLNIKFNSYEDMVLNPIELIKKDDNNPYSTFTAYYNKAKANNIGKPNPQK